MGRKNMSIYIEPNGSLWIGNEIDNLCLDVNPNIRITDRKTGIKAVKSITLKITIFLALLTFYTSTFSTDNFYKVSRI